MLTTRGGGGRKRYPGEHSPALSSPHNAALPLFLPLPIPSCIAAVWSAAPGRARCGAVAGGNKAAFYKRDTVVVIHGLLTRDGLAPRKDVTVDPTPAGETMRVVRQKELKNKMARQCAPSQGAPGSIPISEYVPETEN